MKPVEHFQFMYGDRFWYSDPLKAVADVGADDLYWTPPPGVKCILWHLGHIAHKEEVHIGVFLETPQRKRVHPELDELFMHGTGADTMKETVPDPELVFAWMKHVRAETRRFIGGLTPDGFDRVPPASHGGLNIGQWLGITLVHTGVHLGQIYALKQLLSNRSA